MNVGVVFPTYEIGNDPGLIRDFAQAAEDLGYSHILVFDHVLGAHPDRPEWPRREDGSSPAPHTYQNPMHEVMVTIAYMAGATTRIGFVTGILVLPQRPAVLVAKQAAELAVLRPGGLRLGVGTGWSHVEFEALGVEFAGRGKLMDEQIDLMRELWANDLVDYEGKYHRVRNAGINPRPAATIPIWFGGQSDAMLRRCARLGDGWIPLGRPDKSLGEMRDKLYAYAEEAGRNSSDIGIEVFTNYMPGSDYALHKERDPNLKLVYDAERWSAKLDELEAFGGITHVSVTTVDYGLPNESDHLEAICKYAEALDLKRRNAATG